MVYYHCILLWNCCPSSWLAPQYMPDCFAACNDGGSTVHVRYGHARRALASCDQSGSDVRSHVGSRGWGYLCRSATRTDRNSAFSEAAAAVAFALRVTNPRSNSSAGDQKAEPCCHQACGQPILNLWFLLARATPMQIAHVMTSAHRCAHVSAEFK